MTLRAIQPAARNPGDHPWLAGFLKQVRRECLERRLKFLILRYALKRLAEFLQIAERLATSAGIQPVPDRRGHFAQRVERKLVAVTLQPLQIP
jgi:hypothetical protein